MSKQIKQLEMDVLTRTFEDVQDFVLFTATGVDAQADHQFRASLRKKNIRVQMVKNSLARRVFENLGVHLADAWTSPTLVAWGAGSLAELSREIDALGKKNTKLKMKAAVSERAEIPFPRALTMPTRAEAIGRVVALALSPAARVAGQARAPASRVAGQIKTLRERAGAAEGAAPPAAT